MELFYAEATPACLLEGGGGGGQMPEHCASPEDGSQRGGGGGGGLPHIMGSGYHHHRSWLSGQGKKKNRGGFRCSTVFYLVHSYLHVNSFLFHACRGWFIWQPLTEIFHIIFPSAFFGRLKAHSLLAVPYSQSRCRYHWGNGESGSADSYIGSELQLTLTSSLRLF